MNNNRERTPGRLWPLSLLLAGSCAGWGDQSNYWNTPAGQAATLQAIQQSQAMTQQNNQFQQSLLMDRSRMHMDMARSMQPVKVHHSGTIRIRRKP